MNTRTLRRRLLRLMRTMSNSWLDRFLDELHKMFEGDPGAFREASPGFLVSVFSDVAVRNDCYRVDH